jgi:hypothetical protein
VPPEHVPIPADHPFLAPRRWNRVSFVSVAFAAGGLVLLPFGVVAVVLGLVGLRQIPLRLEKGRAFAVIGMVLGYLEVALFIMDLVARSSVKG